MRTRILGVDPGSLKTGYGCVEVYQRNLKLIGHGVIGLKSTLPFEKRLFELYENLNRVIAEFQPTVLVAEKVFFAKNAVSALKLGQARGVILLCGEKNGLEFFEYNPTQVKSAIVGHGRADKQQVSRIIEMMFGGQSFSSHDASDAVAIATCHAFLAPDQRTAQVRRNITSPA